MSMLISSIAQAQTKLSWEAKNLKNSAWTTVALSQIEKHFAVLDNAEDTNIFCSRYKALDMQDRIWVWGEIISGLALYESAWNPNTQYTETGLGIDQVTGKPLVSEGLLQLSYTDTRWAKWCAFDWESDQKQVAFEGVSILNPQKNLECGIGIMANQIKRKGNIVIGKGAYWSTLKIGHHRNKVNEVARMVSSRIARCKL
jgi:hypothetical protein